MPQPQYHSLAVMMRVCVDQMIGPQLSGRVYCPCLSETEFRFLDVGHMLLQMEEVFDSRGLPAPYNKTRVFEAPRTGGLRSDVMERDAITENLRSIEQQRGEVCTFSILVTTRQNASWQGRVEWEPGKTETFQSALQLIRQIDATIVKQQR